MKAVNEYRDIKQHALGFLNKQVCQVWCQCNC